MRLRLILAALCLTATSCAGSGGESAEPRVPAYTGPNLRIMALGDSITAAEASPGGYRLGLQAELDRDKLPYTFVGSQANGPETMQRAHEGHPGFWIDNIAEQADAWVAAASPDVILLHIGTNDILNDAGAAAPGRLAALIDQLYRAAPNVRLVVTTIVPIVDRDSDRDAYNQAVQALVSRLAAEGKNITGADVGSTITTADTYDGVHPEGEGYEKMSKGWVAPVQSVYAAVDAATP